MSKWRRAILAEEFLNHPNLDWQFYWDLMFYFIDVSRNTQVLILTNGQNQPTPLLSFNQRPFSLSLILSLSVSLSPLFALFPVMFYQSLFCLNTRRIWCPVIIDCNKLIWVTMLFHLRIAHKPNKLFYNRAGKAYQGQTI